MIQGEGPHQELIKWLRRLVVMGGYGTGACWVVAALLQSGRGFSVYHQLGHPFSHVIAALWDRFACFFASALLLTGTWGFQRRRRWGRPILFASAVLMIVTVVAVHVISIIGVMLFPRELLAKATIVAGEVSLGFCECLFSAFLLLCLRRPELKDAFADSHRGFAPLFSSEKATPAIPLSGAEATRALGEFSG